MGWSVVFAMLPAFMYLRRDPRRRWDATASRVLVGGLVVSIALVGWVGPSLFGASVHAQGYFLDGHAQPAFASLTTVIRMARDRSSDMTWLVMLHQRLAMIVTALLLSLIGWQLSAIRRPSIGRAMFWWFALMELVLASGHYAINRPEWQQWRASGILVLFLLALQMAARRSGRGLSAPPAPPALPDPVSS